MLNDICSDSSGYKTLQDKLFHKDTDASETVGMALAMFVEDYPGLAESGMDQRDKKSGSDEEGLFLEPGSDPYEDEKKYRKEGNIRGLGKGSILVITNGGIGHLMQMERSRITGEIPN